MAITIEVDGVEYEGFTNAEVEITLDTISGQFNATSTTLNKKTFPFKIGQSCIVRVDNEQVITGFIENISVNYDAENHEIHISGRDKTCDVIDSSAPEKNEFQGDLSLKSIIEKILSNAGFSDIKVIDNVGNLTNFTKSEISSAESGQRIFEYLKSIAEKKQVFLTTDGKGNIVISRSTGSGIEGILTGLDVEPVYIITLTSDPEEKNSNILSGSVNYELQERFKTITIKSPENVAGSVNIEAFLNNTNSVDKKNFAIDSENIRPQRKLTIVSEKSYTQEQLKNRAEWEVNIRRIKSKTYSCIVQGHTRPDKNGIWRPDQLVKINDVFCDISAILLINTVKFTQSLGDNQGSRTELSFIDKDAYKIEANKPISEKKSNNTGFKFSI